MRFGPEDPPAPVLRLETSSRYYLVAAQRNLWGWELWRAWGGKGSGNGNQMIQPADSEAHAQQLLDLVLKTRLAHGYRPVPSAK